jgi:hypothetical protein
MHGCWSFQNFVISFGLLHFRFYVSGSLGISLLLSLEWRRPITFLHFFKVGPTVPITLVICNISYNIPTSGATHWRVLVVLLVYSVKGGLFTFPVIFTGTASPRVLARYQSPAVNCTKLNILRTVSHTLFICIVQDISSAINCFVDIKEHNCHTFLCKASTLCPRAVSGFCKRNEYSRR